MAQKKTNEDDLVIYNEEQQFYANVSENCTASIKQLEDSIKLQKDIKVTLLAKVGLGLGILGIIISSITGYFVLI